MSGSGLPMPRNGSRNTASTRSRTLSAILRSSDTQLRRSSRNSRWKTGDQSVLPLGKAHLAAKSLRAGSPALPPGSALQSRPQALGVSGRPQEVRGFLQPCELRRRDERDVFRAAAVDHDRLSFLDDSVAERREVRPRGAVGRFPAHGDLLYRNIVRHRTLEKQAAVRVASNSRPTVSASGRSFIGRGITKSSAGGRTAAEGSLRLPRGHARASRPCPSHRE